MNKENEDIEDIEEVGPEPQRLYAGKYKSVDELEKGALEAASSMTKAQQDKAKLVTQLRNAGYDVDDDANIIGNPVPQTSQQPTDWKEEFNTKFFDDPLGQTQQLLAAQRQTIKAASMNTKRELSKYRDKPLFNLVKERLEAELEGVDDSILANPAQAEKTVEAFYKMVVGEHAIETATKASTSPTNRKQMLEALGVGQPDNTREEPDDGISAKELNALEEIGISSKERQAVIESYRKRTRERE